MPNKTLYNDYVDISFLKSNEKYTVFIENEKTGEEKVIFNNTIECGEKIDLTIE